MLQPRPDPVPNDLKLCYERACSLGTAEKDRVNWALMSQPFKTWIAAPSSHILLINGHSENTFISTMSYLCAFVAESLKLERIPSGMYFCGMRCTHDGYPSGPLELVKSLIVQLISRFDFNFDILDRDRNRPNPERINDGKWLCWLLRHLIKQLPSGTVLFWIVDGVSYFESNRLVADTCLVFQKIVEMVTMRKEIIIKLLMTSPYRSCEVGRQLGSQYILNIPEVPDGERQGTFAMELREASRMVPRPQSAQRTSRWGW